MEHRVLKVCIIGAAGSGKTSFVNSLFGKEFSGVYIPTLGVDVQVYNFDPHVTINFWDCAGDPKFSGLGSQYYAGAHACIVMFNLNSEDSIPISSSMIQEFRNACPNALMCFVGNKSDVATVDCPPHIFKCSSKDRESCIDIIHQIVY